LAWLTPEQSTQPVRAISASRISAVKKGASHAAGVAGRAKARLSQRRQITAYLLVFAMPGGGLDRMFSPFDEAAKRAGHRPEIATVTAIAAQYGVVIHPPKQECSDEICLRADGTFRRLGGFNLDSAPQFTSRIAHYLLKSLDFLSSCWLSGPRAWHHARTGLLRAGVYANPRSANGR